MAEKSEFEKFKDLTLIVVNAPKEPTEKISSKKKKTTRKKVKKKNKKN